MQHVRCWLVMFLVGLACAAGADDNRLALANQSDFGAKRGFYLNIENSQLGGKPCRLETLRLILGVADGKAWHFPQTVQNWRYDHDYQVKGVITQEAAELYLDGKQVAHEAASLTPTTGPLETDSRPGWASAPAEYRILQQSLVITSSSGKTLKRRFPAASLSPGLILFEATTPQRLEWVTRAGETLTLEATFRFVHAPDVGALAPLVDRYGQARYAEYPGKVKDDGELQAAVAEERKHLAQWPPAADGDPYGGDRSLGRFERSGFYRVQRLNGRWLLITPEGAPCFYTGICALPALHFDATPVTGRERIFASLPPKQGKFASVWTRNVWGDGDTDYIAYQAVNLIRKYGDDWEARAKQSSLDRIRQWGFSGMGKWCDAVEGVPSVPVLGRGGVPILARHPDPFDPTVRTTLMDVLSRQITPRKNDPWIVGWSIGNEFDEIITLDEIKTILQKPAETPARRALIAHLLDRSYGGEAARLARTWGVSAETRNALLAASDLHPSDADLETMRRFYADQYYDLLYRTVKQIDPNHLYLGFWIVPGWWQNEEDWMLIAPHCDVIGYDFYSFTFSDERLDRLMRATDKPTLCGEFSFPPAYDGARGFGVYDSAWSRNEREEGERYARYVEAAARNPYCVGALWFQYRDQPITGRGPGKGPEPIYGEHYAFGLVDVTDRPHWDLVERMRAANLKLSRERVPSH